MLCVYLDLTLHIIKLLLNYLYEKVILSFSIFRYVVYLWPTNLITFSV